MAAFKIKNTTNSLGKRHPRFNKTHIIEFRGTFGTNTVSINPGAEIVVESDFLPKSAHKLRAEGFIIVQEIDKDTFQKMKNEKEAAKTAEVAEESSKLIDLDEKTKKIKTKIK